MSAVVSYTRVSSGKQRRDGDGLQRQIDQAAAWAADRGLTLDQRQSFSDAGLSASKGHHLEKGAALHEILHAVTTGQLGPSPTLIVEDTSRLSRLEPLDGLERVFLPLIRSGCRIVLLEDGTTYDADTLNQDQGALLMLVLKIQAAAAYARKLKQYGLAHRARNRQQILDGQPACTGWAPSWIEFCDSQWQLSDYAATVARLIELLWTTGTQTTAATLNREGHLSPTGKPWTQGGVRRLLENPALYGARRIADPDHAGLVAAWKRQRQAWEINGANGDPPAKPKRSYAEVADTYPALLTRQRYDQLLAVIAKRSTAPKERGRRDQVRYIGQMLTHCVCGARIGVRHIKAADGSRYSYLFCRGKERGITDCIRPPIRMEPAQAHLLTRLRRDQLALLVEQGTAEVESRAKALLSKQAVLQAALAEQEQQVSNARTTLKERAKAGRDVGIYEEGLDEAVSAAAATQVELSAVLADLASLHGDGLTDQLDAAVQELLSAFVRDDTTVEQRRAVNQLLLRLELVITLDTAEQRLGLSVGDGAVDWQRLVPALDLEGLRRGMTEAVNVDFYLDDEVLEKIKQLPGDEVKDLGVAIRQVLGGDGQALMEVGDAL
jgi:DNA invertase Pin-like site-specific DNA recombinase